MNKPALLLISLAPLVAAACLPAASQPASEAFEHSTQMIVVVTPDWDAVRGRAERFERADTRHAWRAVGEPVAIVVGSKGMGWGIGLIAANQPAIRTASEPVKSEGDGKSPAGVFALGTAFGDSARPLPALKLPYLVLTPSIECVDDTSSKHYNRIVDRSNVKPDWNSSEHMLDVGEAYRWGVVIDHNATVPGRAAPQPGGGSCVFLHIWHSPDSGTAGCTAMTIDNLESLLGWLDPARSPVLVQLPESAYHRLAVPWHLPAPPATVAH